MKTIYKILTASVGGLLIGGTIGHFMFPDVQEKTITELVEVPVTKTITETEIKEVYVDNENLDEVVQTIYDKDGNIEYITQDLDDDEVSKIVDRITFQNDYEKLAKDELRKNLFVEINNEIFNNVKFDIEDLERLKIDEDTEVKNADFDYEDIEFQLTGEFTHDDEEFTYTANVVFKNGKFDELNVITIQ